MPLELLRHISVQPLPLTVTALADIDKVRVLRAAGYVTALLSALENEHPFARVPAITADGRAALNDHNNG